MSSIRALGAALALVLASTPASADDLAASWTWKLEFGASRAVDLGYGLAVGYVSQETFAPQARLFELKVSPRMASAQLAGMPLFASRFQLNDAEPAEASAPAEQPWYVSNGFLWAAGGIAAAALVAGAAGGGGGYEDTTPDHNIASTNDDDQLCADTANPDTCAPPVPGVGFR